MSAKDAAFYADPTVTLHHGDCLDVLRSLPDASVDAVVTDPPYGLEFMGKAWDSFGRDSGAGYQETPRFTDRGSESPLARTSGPNHFRAGAPFQRWCELWAAECLRVLKPGGHMLAFGGTRTFHRLACAIEDAGFEVRDSIAWLYGSGFPKSLDVSKAIDKLDAGEARLDRARRFQAWLREHVTPQQVNAATATEMGHHYTTHPTQPSVATVAHLDMLRPLLPDVPEWVEEMCRQRTVESENFKRREVTGQAVMVDTSRSRLGFAGETYGGDSSSRTVDLTTAHTPEAERWQGWGTALKPAFEPIVVARKPLAGTVAANVLAHGTGALNIDGCRTGFTSDADKASARPGGKTTSLNGALAGKAQSCDPHSTPTTDAPMTGSSTTSTTGPANTVPSSSSPRTEFRSEQAVGRWPANVILDESQAGELDAQSGILTSGKMLAGTKPKGERETYGQDAAGGYETERDTPGDSGGASRFFYVAKADQSERVRVDGIAHPTVKPLALMRWLVRLVTPPGGVVLEPFAGSGTTVEACILEGFSCVAIEREADYLPLIVQRINRRRDPVAAVKAAGDDGGLFDLLDGGAA